MKSAIRKGDKPNQWFIMQGETFLSGPFESRSLAREAHRELKASTASSSADGSKTEGPAFSAAS